MKYFVNRDAIKGFFRGIKGLIVPSKNNNYKSKFLQSRIILFCIVLLLVLKIGSILISVNFPQNIFFADITKIALENFINQARQSAGLGTLTENEELTKAAQLKAQNMVQNQYFSHTSPSGVTPWFWFLKAGYNYKYAGENLAAGFYESKEVYDAWLNSASHKANILNPHYTDVGTAVISGLGPNNAIIVVQEFGSQLYPAPSSANKNPVATQTKNITTTPVPTANTQPTAPSVGQKVLSEQTQAQIFVKPSDKTGTNSLPSRVMNTVLYNYDGLLQNIIYGVSLIMIGVLTALILFSFNIKFSKKLVFRAVIVVILLSLATVLNRDLIISIIPHQVII